MKHNFGSFKLALLLALLLSSFSWAQETNSPGRLKNFFNPDPTPGEVHLKVTRKSWGRTRNELIKLSKPTQVEGLNLKVEQTGDWWSTRFLVAGDQKGNRQMEAGFQMAMGTKASWSFLHKVVQNHATDIDQSSKVALDYRITDNSKLKLESKFKSNSQELGAGFSVDPSPGFSVGAKVKSKRTLTSPTGYSWQQPELEGKLSWSW